MLLTGCAVGPDFHVPDAPAVDGYLPAGGKDLAGGDHVPGRAVARGGEVSPQWWELFRSKTLDRLVQEGLAHNTDLAAAEAAVRVAQFNALAQRGALFPAFSAGFDANRQKTPSQALDTNAASGANIYSLFTPQVSVAFVPDVWGGTRRSIESAEALAQAQQFQREGVYLTLVTNIALAAVEEARLRGQIAATRHIIDTQSQLLELLRRQNEGGQIALTDVLSQETAVAQAKLLLPPLEKALGRQRNLLAFLTGRFPAEGDGGTFQLASFRLPRKLPLSLPGDLVRQRPDIRTAEASLQAVNAQIGVAIANRLPQIAITGNIGSTADKVSQLFTPGTGAWMIAGNVAQTIFDAGTLENKQRAAEAATDQALAQYRGVVLAAFQNVADVLRALQADARTLDAAVAAEASATRNIDLVRRQVERGQVSIPVLLAAQQAVLQTSLARVDAEAARIADTLALFQALGGGWWNRPAAGTSETPT